MNSTPVTSPRRSDDDLTWAVGQVVADRYRIEGLIAQGGMGRVYKGYQEALHRHVAIKVLNLAGTPATEDFRRRFDLEADVLGSLRHPNTVTVFDYGVRGDRPYLVMEHVEGPTLADLMARGPMDPGRVLRLLRQVASALHEAHGKGVTHRDLKPLNIIITEDGIGGDLAKVLDFGMVLVGEAEAAGTERVYGTAGYMAPEQIQHKPVDHRADIYALGVLLFAMLTGRHPFGHLDGRKMLVAHLTLEPPTLADAGLELPPIFEWTVRASLQKDPAKRIASARDFVRALNACEMALRYPDLTIGPELAQGKVMLGDEADTMDGGFSGLEPASLRGTVGRWPWLVVLLGMAAAVVVGSLVVPEPLVQRVLVPVPVPVESEPMPQADRGEAPMRRTQQPVPVAQPVAEQGPVPGLELLPTRGGRVYGETPAVPDPHGPKDPLAGQR